MEAVWREAPKQNKTNSSVAVFTGRVRTTEHTAHYAGMCRQAPHQEEKRHLDQLMKLRVADSDGLKQWMQQRSSYTKKYSHEVQNEYSWFGECWCSSLLCGAMYILN